MPASAPVPHRFPETDPQVGGEYLDVQVRRIMTPGVVTIVEDASLRHVYRALAAHRVHAVLVVGRAGGRPLGWVTARGLLGWLDRDDSLAFARDAITERVITIEPTATAREALAALSEPGISHLIVAHGADVSPEGVVSDLDLVAFAS